MSNVRIIEVKFIEPYDDSDSDMDYIPCLTQDSEDYSSLESTQYSDSSQYTESEYSSSSLEDY